MRKPIKSHTLDGMASHVAQQAEAAAVYSAEELSAEMLKPLGDINSRTGKMEREAPLFFGTGDNPTLF